MPGLLVFLSAFLLFTGELLIARRLLPAFGSSAAVWTTALAFFQAVLFGGYALARRFPTHGKQVSGLHALLVFSPLLTLPFHVVRPELPEVLAVVVALALGIGLPLFALSTTSVLVQRWEAARGREPWKLYALSNAGSLSALALYPLVIERFLGLSAQSIAWAVLYLGFAVLHFKERPRVAPAVESVPAPLVHDRWMWLWLGAGGTALLSATSEILTVDATFPLVWALPLAAYLLSWMIVSAQLPVRPLLFASLGVAGLSFPLENVGWLSADASRRLFYLSLMFAAQLWAQLRLFRARPPKEELGHFYFWVSLGGAVGSISVAVLGPLIFRNNPLPHADLAFPLVALWVGTQRGRPLVSALGLLVIVGLAYEGQQVVRHSLRDGARSFYGFMRVSDQREYRFFTHGTTMHGLEHRDALGEPLAYYARHTPLAGLLERAPHEHTAVLGLGAGTLCAYATAGQQWDFFEIDPLVEPMARAHFSFLPRCAAAVRVLEGDARLTLFQVADHSYDLLIFDAFSSNHVPSHLLTREAFALYAKKLKPGGVLLLNLSNRLFDLPPQAAALAATQNWQARIGAHPTLPRLPGSSLTPMSRWVAVGSAQTLDTLAKDFEPISGDATAWTDDHTDLLSALRLQTPR